MKKIFFTILVLTATLSLLACATGRYVENTTTEVHNHAPGIWTDWYIPERNFGGVSFRISARTGYADSECVVADKESEYILDKALMLRNARVEDRYNVLVTCKEHPLHLFTEIMFPSLVRRTPICSTLL